MYDVWFWFIAVKFVVSRIWLTSHAIFLVWWTVSENGSWPGLLATPFLLLLVEVAWMALLHNYKEWSWWVPNHLLDTCAVLQHYKVTMSKRCHKSVPVLIWL